MIKKFVFRSNKYNVTHQDIQRGIEDRGYVDSNPITSNQSNAVDKWYKYDAIRTDQNIFISSSVNLSKAQIHEAVNNLYSSLNSNQVQLSMDYEPDYKVGYNFHKQKLYNLVEEYLLQNPSQVLSFVKDSNQVILSIPGISIKNILEYQGAGSSDLAMPILKVVSGSIIGHHKDGRFERGLQGPFTEANVGGYKHRHQRIGTTSDRPERYKISDDGTTITFSSPISASTLQYSVPYSRFSRERLYKAVVNNKNIAISGTNALGNFTKKYQVINGMHRKNQNLAFVDRPQNFSTASIDDALLSGVVDRAVPDRTLLDGTYNKSVFVNKFESPQQIQSTLPIYTDANSEEYSPYSTINYRNYYPRLYLQNNLASASYFGGYVSNSFGVSASYQKTQRNNRYIPVSGATTFRLRPDNKFISYQIPARDGGYRWIENAAVTGNNPGLYVNGIDNDINFVKDPDNDPALLAGITSLGNIYNIWYIPTGTYNINITNGISGFRIYGFKNNKIWAASTKKQIYNHDNRLLEIQRLNNIFTDEISKNGSTLKQPVNTKISAISDKYTNVENTYISNSKEEVLSFEFAQRYASIMPNYYDASDNKIKNFYYDNRNIKYKNKENSVFNRLLDYDNFVKSKNINVKKIKSIKYAEKIFPRGQNVFRDFSRKRNAYIQKWSNNFNSRLTETTNSQGKSPIWYDDTISSNTSFNFSYWPMDVYISSSLTSSTPTLKTFNRKDQSGELMKFDTGYISGATTYLYADNSYPGYLFGLSPASMYSARFGYGRNLNTPHNTVFLQSGLTPYFNSYDEYCNDIKLISKGYSILPEYRIGTKLDSFYDTNINIFDDAFNSLELSGTSIEDSSISIDSSSAFVEQRINSDLIDGIEYVNKKLNNFKLNKIKFKINGIKKLLPYDDFYPQIRMLKLAGEFSSSYSEIFTLDGTQKNFATALYPMYSPGIAFNSIKAGTAMPFAVISSAFSNGSKFPWETIINPSYYYQQYVGNANINNYNYFQVDTSTDSVVIDATASINLSKNYSKKYDLMAGNFYSSVVDFFKQNNTLTSIKSKPMSEWYFPDLTKKYSLEIAIKKKKEFLTYSSYESYGFRSLYFVPINTPPWYPSTIASIENYDNTLAPNYAGISSSEAYVKITFDPASLFNGNTDYAIKGKYNIGDILRNSLIEYYSPVGSSSFFNPITNGYISETSSFVSNVEDIVNIFSTSKDEDYWMPYIKWECPTADLNFYNVSASLAFDADAANNGASKSYSYDSGNNVAGNAIRGIWHQYAPISNNDEGLFLNIRGFTSGDRSLTGSLLDIVGFAEDDNKKIGKIASSKEISEAIIVIPFYTDDCGNDTYFNIDIDKFEEMFENDTGIVENLNKISQKYVLPPAIDFIKWRKKAARKLKQEEYKIVKSPFLMFAAEFSSILTEQDLANIWQGVMPSVSQKAELDSKEIEFDIAEYIKDLNYKLPENTRFKIFKVKRKAVSNYQQIVDRTIGEEKEDLEYGYNWPYDYFSLVEMAEVKAELIYDHDVEERKTGR